MGRPKLFSNKETYQALVPSPTMTSVYTCVLVVLALCCVACTQADEYWNYLRGYPYRHYGGYMRHPYMGYGGLGGYGMGYGMGGMGYGYGMGGMMPGMGYGMGGFF